MIAEAGLFCLILAMAAAFFQAALPLMHAGSSHPPFHMAQRGAAMGQFLCLTVSLYALIYAYLTSDFSVAAVADNSHSAKPALYKFTGAWANHEGSILLWAWVLALFGFLLARARPARGMLQLHSRALAAQGAICLGTLLFILCASNPFARRFPHSAEGAGLNPLLQDIGLALHPPMLYLGYVGFSIVFSLAAAALLTEKMGKGWARLAHPWIMFSWAFLTLGIGLGGWWAYRELGWGGWWFWDPVENASLLPWLAGTALLHSNLALAKRGLLQRWVLLLAILTFSLSLLGTFLVRSGLLTSVHAFASDPTRGLFILAYIVCVTGGALWLYATRAIPDTQEQMESLASREGGILLNNLFLITGCATVLLATAYPLIMQALDLGAVSVGPPYYRAAFIPLMVPLAALAAIGPFLPWKQGGFAARRLRFLHPAWLAALAGAGLTWYAQAPHAALSALGIGLSLWLGMGCLGLLAERGKLFRAPPAQSLRRLRRQPAGFYAMLAGHAGLALLAAGITASALWQQEMAMEMRPGDAVTLARQRVSYLREQPLRGANYAARRSLFEIRDGGGNVFTLAPEIRYFPGQDHATSEAAIYTAPSHDFYAVTGGDAGNAAVTARFYHTPLMWCVWGGFLLMAGGGMLSWAGSPGRREHGQG